MAIEPISSESLSGEFSAALPEAAGYIRNVIELMEGEDLPHVTCGDLASEWLTGQADSGQLSVCAMSRFVGVLKRMSVSDEDVKEVLALSILPALVEHPVLAHMLYERTDSCLDQAIELLHQLKKFIWPPPTPG